MIITPRVTSSTDSIQHQMCNQIIITYTYNTTIIYIYIYISKSLQRIYINPLYYIAIILLFIRISITIVWH